MIEDTGLSDLPSSLFSLGGCGGTACEMAGSEEHRIKLVHITLINASSKLH
jgi:hypothetical protein